jgi:hypothetical protein
VAVEALWAGDGMEGRGWCGTEDTGGVKADGRPAAWHRAVVPRLGPPRA